MWEPPSSAVRGTSAAAARVERTLLSAAFDLLLIFREPGRARLRSYPRAIRIDRDAGFRPARRDTPFRQYFLELNSSLLGRLASAPSKISASISRTYWR